MDATTPALLTQLNTSIPSVVYNNLDFWIKVVTVGSGLIVLFFTALAIIIGFLVFRQNQMRQDAEKEMAKINRIGASMGKLYASYQKVYQSSAKLTAKLTKQLELIDQKSKETTQLTEGIKADSADVKKAKEDILAAQGEIQKGTATIANITPFEATEIPSIPGYEDYGLHFVKQSEKPFDFTRPVLKNLGGLEKEEQENITDGSFSPVRNLGRALKAREKRLKGEA